MLQFFFNTQHRLFHINLFN